MIEYQRAIYFNEDEFYYYIVYREVPAKLKRNQTIGWSYYLENGKLVKYESSENADWKIRELKEKESSRVTQETS